MARCLDGQVVRQQLATHYPQAGLDTVPAGADPLRLAGGERAWGMTLRASGPEYVPLRVFRDDDLLDAGSDPLIALLGRARAAPARASASWRGCCCARSAPTGRRLTSSGRTNRP